LWSKALKLYEYLDWEPWIHVCVTATLWHAFWLALGNFMLWGLYHFQIVEKYKVIKGPWPWEKDREAWISLVKLTLCNVGFNSLILFPVVCYWSACQDNFEV
jgi:hypothetical protein